jgi:hypothetical protein
MQAIWTKILAGEVQKPGSFSVRTLECLRNLSTTEAHTFQRILPFVTCTSDEMFIYDDDNNHIGIGEECSIKFSDLLLLNECNLALSNRVAQYATISPHSIEVELLSNSNLVCMVENPTDTDIKLSWPVYPLTSAGKELALALHVAANEEYSLEVMKAFAKKHNDTSAATVSVHKVVGRIGSEIMYQKEAIPLE